MRKRILPTLIFTITVLLLVTVSALTVSAEEADSGVVYEIGADGTYVIVTGISDKFPSVNIDAEIEGLPVKEIADSAFQNNYSLYRVTIPDSVEKIGEAAFRNCRSLVSVRLPSTLTFLPFECFRDCSVLSDITLPQTLTTIDDMCFQGCTKLGDLKIPASVSRIGHDVFMNCESIRLDVSENDYAREYALANSVNTEFKGTSAYFFLMMLLGCAVAAVIATVLILLFKHHIKKHPTHDPAIYIGKAFRAIGRGIRFAFGKIKSGVLCGIEFIIDLSDKNKKG